MLLVAVAFAVFFFAILFVADVIGFLSVSKFGTVWDAWRKRKEPLDLEDWDG